MKLYGFPMSPNTRRAMLMLEEVGAGYENVLVDLMQGAHRQTEYLAINPNGRVPCLVDGDFVLWESNAILEYLAERHPDRKLGPSDARERGEMARWMFLNAAHLGPAMAAIFAHTMRLPEPDRIPAVAQNGRAEVARSLRVVDAALAGRPYLAGERYSIADVSLAPTLGFAPMLGVDLSEYPHVQTWFARVQQRPSWRMLTGG